MKTELNANGQLVIDMVDLAQKDTALLRSIAQHAIFDDILLHAMAEIAVKGEVSWSDEEPSWWIGSSSFGPNFERFRTKLCELAPEASRVLLHEITRQRDIAMQQADIFRDRAWTAERLIKYHGDKIPNDRMDERDRADIRIVNARPAHAEIDWEKIMGRTPIATPPSTEM